MEDPKRGGEEPSFEDLLEAYSETPRDDFRPGEAVTGTVVAIDAETIFVEFGGRGEGTVAAAEFMDEKGRLSIAVGDRVDLRVASSGAQGATLTRGLKLRGADALAAIREAYQAGLPLEGTIKDVNPGGYEVDIGGVRAFCPMGQVDIAYHAEPQALVGLRDRFKVIEFKESGRRIVLSRRAVLEEVVAATRRELEKKLVPGAVLPGLVTRIEKFGAFVDLGGIEGLVHVSELAHRRIEHPSDLLQRGQSVEVAVLRVDANAAGKTLIGLSLKALERDPWDEELGLTEGEVVTGTVRRLQPFGAFVEVAPGIEGLIHVSEMSWERIRSPGQVLQVGQEVRVRILAVDRDARRIALSLKHAEPAVASEPGEKWEAPKPDKPTLGSVMGDALRKIGRKPPDENR